MTVDELFRIFRNHGHTGTLPDAKPLEFINTKQTYIILISPNGTKYLLGVDDDGAVTSTLYT